MSGRLKLIGRVGLLNPGVKPLAGKLRGDEADEVGGHWWGEALGCAEPNRAAT
jgi:hypothetical protein